MCLTDCVSSICACSLTVLCYPCDPDKKKQRCLAFLAGTIAAVIAMSIAAFLVLAYFGKVSLPQNLFKITSRKEIATILALSTFIAFYIASLCIRTWEKLS